MMTTFILCKKILNMNRVAIYHNPNCGTSGNPLAIIPNTGILPQVIEYLTNPPTFEQIQTIISGSNLNVREVFREKEAIYIQLNLHNSNLTDDQLLEAMLAHPILINRPFVIKELGVRLCRQSELVLDILPCPN